MKRFSGTTLCVGVVGAAIAAFLVVGLATVAGYGGEGVRESALGLSPVVFEVPTIDWSNRPTFPTELREAALSRWVGILRLASLLLVLAATVPVVFGALMSGALLRPTLLVHRDVGAPAGLLRRRAAGLALGLVATAALLAGVLLIGLIPSVAAAWPEIWRSRSGVVGAVTLILTLAILVAGVLASGAFWQTAGLLTAQANARRVMDPSIGGLSLVQAAASTVVIVLAMAVLRDASPAIVPAGQADEGRWWVAVQANTPIDSATLMHSLGSIPEVEGVGATTPGGWDGLGVIQHVATQCGSCWTGDIATPMLGGRARIVGVAGDALRLLGVEVIEGRGLSEVGANDPKASLVSERFGGRMFEGGNAVGRATFIGSDLAAHDVRGVVDDPTSRPGLGAPRAHADRVYLSLAQHPVPNMEIVVQGSISQAGLQGALVPMLPDATRIEIRALTDHREAVVAPLGWISNLLVGLLVGCVLLSLLAGILGARLQVRTRQYEIGVRRAVGATRARVLGWVLGTAVARAGLGILAGLWLALFFRDPVSRLLGADVSFGSAMLAAAAVQLAAVLVGSLPATIRAVHWDPQEALGTRMVGHH